MDYPPTVGIFIAKIAGGWKLQAQVFPDENVVFYGLDIIARRLSNPFDSKKL